MSDFKYKTRGMVSPQGKPKVYFCCHPEDFSSYFPMISDEILRYQNCAVYYRDVTGEENLTDLEEMQLLVIPVTWKLLKTPNAAMDVEYPYALKHHIPVLPWVQEQGLLKLFSERFGQTQFLDATVSDRTAIRMEEKLHHYLEKILLGDEMAEKVRAAFDAYVFLSYRKKDRAYAQKLMRLIHKNEFCRDIAIWYDEYLTPGENFNEAIRQAITKSDLFVMSVTPNLVNEENYIMTTEYPLAVQTQKQILPVETVYTDKQMLAEKYKGIPECVQVNDGEKLSEILRKVDKIRQLAIQPQKDMPEHNYFIGLAYLRGIDVEVDFERARELITSSAEFGLPEAFDMLASMYRFGIGVEQNYERMLQWQKKKMMLREKQYLAESTDANLLLLFQDILVCGDSCMEIGRFSAAEELYRKAEQYQKHFENRGRNAAKRNDVHMFSAMIFHRIADVLMYQGNMKDAESYIKKGLEISNYLAEQVNDEQSWKHLAASYLKQGDFYNMSRTGSIRQIQEAYKKCLGIWERYIDDSMSAEERKSLTILYNRLGDLAQQIGEKKKAVQLEMRKTMAGKLLSHLVKRSDYEEDLLEAKHYFEKSSHLCEQLAEELQTSQAKHSLAVSYNRLGDFYLVIEDCKKAKEYNKKYKNLCENLVKEVQTEKMLRERYVSYQKYGESLHWNGEAEKARQYYENGHKMCEELAKKSESPDIRADLAISYHRLFTVTGDEIYQEKAIRICREVIMQYPDVGKYRQYLKEITR